MLDELLAGALSGRSGALVIRGEAGIGKSALMDYVRGAAPAEFRVEYSTGAESESEFAFAGLYQLCGSLLDRLGALPEPQRFALEVAFGRRAGTAPDRFLVGLATLNLLAEVAEDRPLLCLVDDAQWLDEASAQVLAFVARRISAERVAMVLCLREVEAGNGDQFSLLREVHLGGLGDSDAHVLLAAAFRTPLDDVVSDRIVAEARGNPLALLELPLGAPSAQLAGGFEHPDVVDVPRRVEEAFRHRSATLPAETQLLLLVAAADPTGDAELLWRAAGHLGIAQEAAAPGEAAGLVEIDGRVRFRHPLVRSAVYQTATSPDRRRAHQALADATDPARDPERRAWHRARAVSGTDEDVAAELERSAGRARDRGGMAAAAAFLQQAAELTPDPGRRASRALEAAHARYAAGSLKEASELLAVAAGATDALQQARLELLRAQISFQLTRGREVPGVLLEAARTIAPLDAVLARETYLAAFDAALVNGGREAVRVAGAAKSIVGTAEHPRPPDLLLDALIETFTGGFASGVPALRIALEAFRDEAPGHLSRDDGRDRWLWLAGRNAIGILDDELAYVLTCRHVQLARATGALATLPAALNLHTSVLSLAGELAHAGELSAEAGALTEATGASPLRHGLVMLAAWRGDHSDTVDLSDVTRRDAANPHEGGEIAVAQYALAVLHNGLGNYAEAQAAAAVACETDEQAVVSISLPELIEAAVRAGHARVAADALERLDQRALACDTHWALGLAARSRALTRMGAPAEDSYREAIERLGQSRMTSETARGHLLFGEWLRREGRRQDARAELRRAHELLSDMGAEAFAERAARELRATGENPRRRTAQPTDVLTDRELHIARVVATGATSREVADQLFLSPRTIEAHLRSIFRKLDVTSRRQLRDIRLP